MKKQFALLSGILAIAAASHAQTVIYVDDDATGNNDGTSWTDAYTDLSVALNVNTVENAQIWIAEGFYTRFSSNQSFVIDNNEDLYGGFSGNETDLNQRDIENNPTILSGDVNWDDSGAFSIGNITLTENAKRIIDVQSNGDVIINGLIIERAFSTNSAGNGIGVSSTNLQSLTVQHCKIRENIGLNRAGLMYYSDVNNSEFNFFNNQVEDNVNLGNSAFTIEFRSTGNVTSATSTAHVVNNLFRNNTANNPNVGGTCGRFTNTADNCALTVNFLNNTVVDNSQGTNPTYTSPFCYEIAGSATSSVVVFVNNNIFYQNTGATQIMSQSNSSSPNAYVSTSGSWQNVQDFPDLESYTNTTVVSTSPFMDYNNDNFVPISSFQTTGRYQAYLTTYPTLALNYVNRLTQSGAIGIGAHQAADASLKEETNSLKVFPNPASDYIEINSDEIFEAFAIYTMNGQLVKSGKLESTTIDIRSLTSGSYVLVVDNKNHSVEKQLIIE